MVSIPDLWLPIVLSAVIVFAASSVIHMVLTYHRNDYKKLPAEAAIMDALRPHNLQPGDYFLPHATGPKDLKHPEVMEKFNQGPVALMTVLPNGPPAMGKSLAQWFVFCLIVGIFVAYLAGRTWAPGTPYLAVFRVAGATAFLGYAAAQAMNSIWMGQAWPTTAKHMFDGLLYGLLTAGTFAWLWP